MKKAQIAIVGGSGLYDLSLEEPEEITFPTPYGTANPITVGKLHGVPVAFLARHGANHKLLPNEVPYRANVYALKLVGARYLISVSAVGSLREDIRPGSLVLPDQFIDMTKGRANTFFGNGVVAHVSLADPVCSVVTSYLTEAQTAVAANLVELHPAKTYVCIDGPQFSTRAESRWFRSIGADIVGMTGMPEAKLAREAGIAYATLGVVTDFDSWDQNRPAVSAQEAVRHLKQGTHAALLVAQQAIQGLSEDGPSSPAHSSLGSALLTSFRDMDAATKARLRPLLSPIKL